jgi:hypothetical protein
MGRKSSAKGQARPTTPSTPPPGGRSFTPILIVALVALIAGAVASFKSASGVPDPNDTTAQTLTPAAGEPPAVALKPHPQEHLPPLPFSPEPPSRPMEVVRAVYKFAAEHPEVLSYVPCYCGCERSGHRGNEDCFVTARAENGDVVEWEPHGIT